MESAPALQTPRWWWTNPSAVDLIPAAVVLGAGVLTIAFWSAEGRRAHVYWLCAVLAHAHD